MSSPSPVCTVQDGGGAAQSTTNGVDVTAGNTITIALASTAGVNSWVPSIVGEDGGTAAPTITINNTNKTATFTAPTAPWSFIFDSVVNNGIDTNGVVQPSYSTTFKVSCKTGGGLRLLASGETTEGSITVGWVSEVNAGIKASGGGGFTAGGDLSGTSSSQQVVGITGSGGAIAVGPATVTWDTKSVSNIQTTSTTSATPADVYGYTLSSGQSARILFRVVGVCTGGSSGTVGTTFSQDLVVCFKDVSGTVTQVGSTTTGTALSDSGASAWSVALATSGAQIGVALTGAANVNIDWTVATEVLFAS